MEVLARALADAIGAWFWLMGIAIAMLGSSLTVLGLILQKEETQTDAPATGRRAPAYWARCSWMIGFSVWLLGNALCWVAAGLAPQSLLACLNSWNVAVVFVLAPRLLGEAVTPEAVWSAALLAAGCAWTVVTGPKAYHLASATTLRDAWLDPAFCGVLVCTGMLLVGCGAVAGARWRSFQGSEGPMLPPWLYAIMAAVLAWYSVILSKSTSMLAVSSVYRADNQVLQLEFWVFSGGLVVLALITIHFLNMAMRHGDAVVVLPIYEATSMTGQIVLGGIFFHEFREFRTMELMSFSLGVVAVLSGVVCLSRSGLHRKQMLAERVPLAGDKSLASEVL